MYLFFDTETTGIPLNYKAPVTDLRNWPRMVQIAWVLSDGAAAVPQACAHIVKPEGFTIPADATRVHGITTARAQAEGILLKDVLAKFAQALDQSSVVVAHNMAYDEKIVGAEFLRTTARNRLDGKRRVCTMQGSTDFCRLPGPRGYKWPTLNELHKVLFKAAMPSSHNAVADVEACARCFFELRRRGVLAG